MVSLRPPSDLAPFLDIMTEVLEATHMIAETVPQVQTVMKRCSIVQMEINQAANLNQSTVRGLRMGFQKCTLLAKRYVFACVAMAQFASSQKIAEVLERDLKEGYVHSLREFIKEIFKLITVCSERFNEFHHDLKAVNEKTDQALKEHNDFEISKQGTSSRALQPNPNIDLALKVVGSMKAISVAGGYMSAGLGSQGFLSGRMAALTMGGCAITGAASWGMQKYLETKRASGETASDKETAVNNAGTEIARIVKKMNRVELEVNEIDALKEHAAEILKSFKDLPHGARASDLVAAGLRQRISDLQEFMSILLEKTGLKGENVSPQPLQLLKREILEKTRVAAQESDSGDEKFEYGEQAFNETRLPVQASLPIEGDEMYHPQRESYSLPSLPSKEQPF